MIEINGIQYEQIQHESPNKKKGGRLFGMAAMMLAMSGVGMGGGSGGYTRSRPNVNIVEEYGRIERKESFLCRSDREWVKRQFEYNYKKIL